MGKLCCSQSDDEPEFNPLPLLLAAAVILLLFLVCSPPPRRRRCVVYPCY
ncbi:hypothetical protein BRADI_2g60143v3 [Brachypodium distachyon]|uniref:Uncharacterized protein n=1 Tax=Brachypodium distachyon TaxID=15368 RepID=A0A0Q3GLT5_BRADI|nr:hypothetical protein BRADI_2g60143v3 [Brachypodium distachyon]